MEDMFRIGVIATTHGLKGEVKVFPTTEEPARFKDLKKCYIRTKEKDIEVEKKSCRFFKNMVILGFQEFDTIEQVEGLRQCEIYVKREDAIPLEENEYYIADILDAEVYEENGNKLGILTDVLFTGANDVYSVRTEEGKEILIPVIPECVLEIDTEKKRVTVKLMRGMLE